MDHSIHSPDHSLHFTLLWISFLACGFLVWFFTSRAKQKERLLLIEKGLNPDEVLKKDSRKLTFPWLKIGIILIGIGIALVIISILALFYSLNHAYAHLFLAIFGLCTGAAFIVAHYVGKTQDS